MSSIIPVIHPSIPEGQLLHVTWQSLPDAQPIVPAYTELLHHVTTHPVCRVLLDLRQQEPAGLEPAQQWVARELLPCLLSCNATPPPRVACVPPPAYYQQLLIEATELVNQSELLTLRYFSDYPHAIQWLRQEIIA